MQSNHNQYNQFIRQLKFSSIYLENIKAKRLPHIDFEKEVYTNLHIIDKYYESISDNTWKVSVKLQFSAQAEKTSKKVIDITAVIVAIYESRIDFDDEIFSLFSSSNLMLNLWPYFRELFQSMTIRMGLPPYILPPLFLGPGNKQKT